jgi:hypothetical protein
MAAPNLLNSTQILGKTVIANVTTVLSNVIVNDTNSGNLIKVDTMTISNYSANQLFANVILQRGSAQTGYIVGTVAVPAYSTLTTIARDTALLMEETDYIQANVNANVSAHMTISYEVVT